MDDPLPEPRRSVIGDSLTHCPDCGSTDLAARVIDGDVTFQCAQCEACWQVALGHARRVRRTKSD